MTVPIQDPIVSYTGNGIATAFTIPFRILLAEDLIVNLSGVLTSAYTLSGLGDDESTLTFTTAPASGVPILAYRQVALERQTDYQFNGDLRAVTVNADFDRIWMALQDQGSDIGRAIVAPTADINPQMTLPGAVARANKALGFDNNGNPFVIDLIIGSVASPVVNDIDMLRLVDKNAALDAFVLGLNAAYDGNGGGKYFQDTTDTTTDESVPVIIVAADGARWKLIGALATGMNVTGGQQLSNTPFGSPLQTDSSFLCLASTQSANQQFMAQFEFVSNRGTNPLGGNVTLYSAIKGQANSGPVWAFNTVTALDSGFPFASTSAFGYELDINNLAGAYGDFGVSNSVGLMFNGLGFLNTAAMYVNTGTGTPIWYYGMRFAAGSVQQSTLQDFSDSVVSLDIRGVHQYGLDFGNASPFTGGALRIGYDVTKGTVTQGIVCSQGNDSPFPVIGCDTNGHVTLGGSAIGNHFVAGHFQPITDNTYFCGTGSFRWASLWSANGTIQTSDPKLKTDIAPLPASLPIVKSLNPSTWKWIDGGSSVEMVDTQESYQVTEPVTATELSIEMRDGVPVQVSSQITRDVPVFDTLPVVDESGAPVMQTIPARPEKRDSVTGEVISPARAATTMPLTHSVPRMATRTVQTASLVPHAGTRTHWGFLAPDVKAAFETTGMDFAGYVVDEEGTQHLRPDQLIPVLWKAVQELTAQVEALQNPPAATGG
ncbi:tail fiber domain-containing protein [Caballeronia sp. dw_19]|uniref:tail fiber domain-containing protein n=1 Tax=Caballeronia sp. dw_19 TaxID=2719791 RepID=UPI001BD358C7|nr:tail fiber domain-containing protein [Caballeronia sp. dw_19]